MVVECPAASHSVSEQLTRAFSRVPGVGSVKAHQIDERSFRVKVFMADFDQKYRFQVYDKEDEILREFPFLRIKVSVIDASANSAYAGHAF